MKFKKIIIASFFSVIFFNCYSQTIEEWQSDLRFMYSGMQARHPNLYHHTTKKNFDGAVENLYKQIPTLNTNQRITGFACIVALAGEGHAFMGFNNLPVVSKRLPLQVYVFSDGIYVINAQSDYSHLIGKKIISINNQSIEDVYKLVSSLIPFDNAQNCKQLFPFYAINTQYLNGLGITPDDSTVSISLKDAAGKQVKENVLPVSLNYYTSWITQQKITSNYPWARDSVNKPFYFSWNKEKKIIQLYYETITDNNGTESLTAFAKRLDDFINTNEVNRVIINVRDNGGGDLTTCQPLVNVLIKNDKINERGKLFLLTGRKTFSAASYFVTKLELNTKALFVGEPIGQTVNHYGDPVTFVLPKTKMQVAVSSYYWFNTFKEDKREYNKLDIPVSINSKDYFAGNDIGLNIASDTVINDRPSAVTLSYSDSAAICGKYLFTIMQPAEVTYQNNRLHLTVFDTDPRGRDVSFISSALYPVNSDRFETDIAGMAIVRNKASGDLYIEIGDNKMKLKILKNNFESPLQLISDGKTEEALDMLRKVREALPNHKIASEFFLMRYAQYLQGQKNTETSTALFKLNTEFFKRSVTARMNFAEALLSANKKEEALENFKKALELEPANENAKKMIEQIKNGRN